MLVAGFVLATSSACLGEHPYRSEYRIVVVIVIRACVMSAGNAGSTACRSNPSAASSNNVDPDGETISASTTRPDLSTVNRTATCPSSPRRRAYSG